MNGTSRVKQTAVYCTCTYGRRSSTRHVLFHHLSFVCCWLLDLRWIHSFLIFQLFSNNRIGSFRHDEAESSSSSSNNNNNNNKRELVNCAAILGTRDSKRHIRRRRRRSDRTSCGHQFALIAKGWMDGSMDGWREISDVPINRPFSPFVRFLFRHWLCPSVSRSSIQSVSQSVSQSVNPHYTFDFDSYPMWARGPLRAWCCGRGGQKNLFIFYRVKVSREIRGAPEMRGRRGSKELIRLASLHFTSFHFREAEEGRDESSELTSFRGKEI